MTVFEVVLPSLKNDPVLLQEFAEKILPGFLGQLREAGVRNGHRGTVVTEDGRDQREEHRAILVLGPRLSPILRFRSTYHIPPPSFFFLPRFTS